MRLGQHARRRDRRDGRREPVLQPLAPSPAPRIVAWNPTLAVPVTSVSTTRRTLMTSWSRNPLPRPRHGRTIPPARNAGPPALALPGTSPASRRQDDFLNGASGMSSSLLVLTQTVPFLNCPVSAEPKLTTSRLSSVSGLPPRMSRVTSFWGTKVAWL